MRVHQHRMLQHRAHQYRAQRGGARETGPTQGQRSITARRGAKEFFVNTGKSTVAAFKSPLKAIKRGARAVVVGSNVLLTHQTHEPRNKSYDNFDRVMGRKDFGTAVRKAITSPLRTARRVPKAIAAGFNYASQFHQSA